MTRTVPSTGARTLRAVPNSGNARRTSTDERARVGAVGKTKRTVASGSQYRANSTQCAAPSRIPMSEQLTGLAPEGAVGYRLVLPTRTPMMSRVCLSSRCERLSKVTIPPVRFRAPTTFD